MIKINLNKNTPILESTSRFLGPGEKSGLSNCSSQDLLTFPYLQFSNRFSTSCSASFFLKFCLYLLVMPHISMCIHFIMCSINGGKWLPSFQHVPYDFIIQT